MNKRLFLLVSITLFVASVHSQVAMGKWRTHFAYNTINQITQSENKIFAVSNGALFALDKNDGSMELFSKISGLNGTVISRIEYDDVNKVLLIIYQDGNIDFMSAGGVKNLPDFNNKQMSADKSVNNILVYKNRAYLSCKFGIITLNMLKMEIQDTYYIGDNAAEVEVLNITIHNDNIYAVSAANIYTAAVSNPQLINYESWSKMSNLPGSGNIRALYSFSQNLILLRGGKLYKQGSDGAWSSLDVNQVCNGILVSGDYLQVYTAAETYIFDKQFGKHTITGIAPTENGAYDTVSSKFWFAVGEKGLATYQINGANPSIKYYPPPDGPAMNIPYRMKFAGERLFVVPGGRWASQFSRPGIVMIYESNQWKNISNLPIIEQTNHEVFDFVDVAIDPTDNKHFFTSSYGTGIFEFRNNEFYKWHYFDNSTIETIYPADSRSYFYMRMSGGVFDEQGNVWFANTSASNSFKILKKDGTWLKLGYANIANLPTLGEILINNKKNSQKWMLSLRYTPGIGIIDDNGTIDDKTDDKSVFRSTFNYSAGDGIKSITPEFFFCMEQEKNGTVWVGTKVGPLLFNNPSKAFDENFMCSRVIIPRNDGTGNGDYLLEDQAILSMAIDGANRKWLGTEESGVYLMSENGQETIHHFTTKNSPLISNTILSIAINPVTGEVFFGTGNGLVSYQSDAIEAGDLFKNVHVYPNPVRETFKGKITIAGLVEKTSVKITDITGNLVCETSSNGSIATWDGKNKYGQRVSTGVYLAICISPDGQQSATTKILIVN